MRIYCYGYGKAFSDFWRLIVSLEKKIDGIYDSSLINSEEKFVKDTIPIVSADEILKCDEKAKVYILLYNKSSILGVSSRLASNPNLEIIVPCEKCKTKLTGKELLEQLNGAKGEHIYSDVFGNSIKYDETIPIKTSIEWHGANNKIEIEKRVKVSSKLQLLMGTSASVKIGEKTTFLSATVSLSNGECKIGKDCLFSSNIEIRNHDGHHIFDYSSRKRLNYSKNVYIGDHVWIGYNVMILKGTTIGNGSIVGMGAICTREYDENSVIVGNPAKVVRKNIYWRRDLTYMYNYDEDPYKDKIGENV